MKCLKCGKEMLNGESFCIYCGNVFIHQEEGIDNIQNTPKAENVEKELCRHCGKPLLKGVVICNSCGRRVDADSETEIHEDIKTKNGLLPYIIALIVVIICCVGIITYIYYKKNSMQVETPDVNYSEEKTISDDGGETHENSVKSSDSIDESEMINAGGDDVNKEEYEQNVVTKPVFETVSATSVLKTDGKNTYYAENVCDKNTNTAWNEGVSGSGSGEQLTFSAGTEQKVKGIRILNGYCKNKDVYYQNNRPKQVKIIFDDGRYMSCVIPDEMNAYYDMNFGEIVSTSEITIEIVSVYPGSKYDDTCITEVEFY